MRYLFAVLAAVGVAWWATRNDPTDTYLDGTFWP